MIDYTDDIVTAFFSDEIASDPNYEVPGNYNLQASFASLTPGKKRLLTFIEVFRAYLAEVESDEEAKLIMDILTRVQSWVKIGSKNTPIMGDRAAFYALSALAARIGLYRLS